MSSLYVYTTEGTCIYPEDGSDDASINRYFESVNFVADTRDPTNPSIEAYFRAILPSGRPEQLFLRFQGDDPDSLFEDCRSAVLDELVTAGGWEVQETDDSTDPSMLFQRAVLRPAVNPSEVLEGTSLAGRMQSLSAAVHGSGQSLTVTGRNYETIADAIRTLADESMVMAVTDGNVSLSGVELVFNQTSQQHDLALPRESQQVLQQVAQQDTTGRDQTATPDEQHIESELSEIRTQLQAIAEKDVNRSTVREQLDSVVSEVYPSLSVSEPSTESRLSTGRSGQSEVSTTSDEPVGTPPSGGQSSGISPNISSSVALGAFAGLAVVVLLAVVVASGVIGSGGGESEFEVNITSAENVTAGEPLEIGVLVENNGSASGNHTVEVDASSLGTSEKSVEVEANRSKRETFTIQTEEGDGGSYEITVEGDNVNNSDTRGVRVLEPATFTVSDLTVENEPVVAGDRVEVTAEIDNTGDINGTQTVELSSDIGSDSANVTLAEGESAEQTLSVQTEEGDAGEYDITVETEDDSSSRIVTVLEPAFFEVTIVGADKNKTGEKILVTFEVENTGGVKSTEEIQFSTNPAVGNDSRRVELLADESKTIRGFSIPLNDDVSGTITLIATVDGEQKDDFDEVDG